jgi:hypothetical protein
VANWTQVSLIAFIVISICSGFISKCMFYTIG